jgi:hypothetical protein
VNNGETIMRNNYTLFIPYYISIMFYKISKTSGVRPKDILHFVDRNFLEYHLPGLFSIVLYKMYLKACLIDLIWTLIIYFVNCLLLYLVYEIGYILNEYVAYKEDIRYRSLKISHERFSRTFLIALILSRILYFIIASYLALLIFSSGFLIKLIPMYGVLFLTFMLHNVIPVEWRIRSSYPMLKTLKALGVLYPIAFDVYTKIFTLSLSFSLGILENVYYTLKKYEVANLWRENPKLRFLSIIIFTFLAQISIGYLIIDNINLGIISYLTFAIGIYYILFRVTLKITFKLLLRRSSNV